MLTKVEKDIRFELLGRAECICCILNSTSLFQSTKSLGLAIERHHLNAGGKSGGKKLGDEFTSPLCSWHHRGSFNQCAAPGGHDGWQWQMKQAAIYGPSWAMGTKLFRPVYGDDADMLEMANALIERIGELDPA